MLNLNHVALIVHWRIYKRVEDMFTKTKMSLLGSLAVATTAAAAGWWFDQQMLVAWLFAVGLIGILHRRLIAELWLRFMDKRHFSQDQMDPTDFSLKPKGVAQHSAIALYWTWTRIKQISPTEAPALFGFFAVAFIVLLTLRTDILEFDKDFFQSNIVPEIFGFLLDGLLILGVLGYWAKRKAAKEKEALRNVLRDFLWRYAALAAFKLRLSGDPKFLLESRYASYRILNRFTTTWPIATSSHRKEFLTEIANLVETDTDAAMALLPVAATLGSDHARVWLDVISVLGKLKDCATNVSVHTSFISLMGAIIELDDLNFLGEEPKLNLQQLVNLR